MSANILRLPIVLVAVVFATHAQAQVTLTEGTNFTIDVSADGRIAIDLLGGIWVLSANGGAAEPVTSGLLPAKRPRWSPDGNSIVFEAQSAERTELRLYQFDGGAVRLLGDGRHSDQYAAWHPDGERIVFSSARDGGGLDLWELDVPTGLSWRISNLEGDESEPAWSADGRSLVYVNEHEGQWSLMLRRFGEPDIVLLDSETRLSAPSWRPDGSLVTFARHHDDGVSISMLILSDPLLERTLIDEKDLFLAPVAWLGRQQMFYAAGGLIRTRAFNSWVSRAVPFRATIGSPVAQRSKRDVVRDLPMIDAPDGRIVLRAARLFDGVGGGYRKRQDIVIEGGRIVAVDERQDRPGEIVFDLGDLTVLPGFIDGYGALPADVDESAGPLLLTFGVTTIIAEHERVDELTARWSGKDMPGPRVLAATSLTTSNNPTPWLVTLTGDMNTGLQLRDSVDSWQQKGVPVLAETWQAGMGSGASLLLGAATLPASPGGHRYQNMDFATGDASVTIISGLADAQTPGLESLLASRQARLLRRPTLPVRRFTAAPRLAAEATTVVIGSKPNGLAPGVGLHAEFRALAAAGLTPEQTLRAAGVNAAAALGLGLQLGRIATGSLADLVIVDGNPLEDINATLNVVGVVRNGRFHSTIGLIERIRDAGNVE